MPATGVPIDSHQPLSVLLSLPLCGKCFDALKVSEWILPPVDGEDQNSLRKLFEIAARASVPEARRATHDPVPPDFERAFFTRVSMDSADFKKLESARGTMVRSPAGQASH